MYSDRLLEDEKRLSDYGIEHGSILCLEHKIHYRLNQSEKFLSMDKLHIYRLKFLQENLQQFYGKIYFNGYLIESFHNLSSQPPFDIYINYNIDNEQNTLCYICGLYSPNMIFFELNYYCEIDFKNILKTCEECKMKSYTIQYIVSQNKFLCTLCESPQLIDFTLIFSFNYQHRYEWLIFHEDLIIYTTNQTINIMQNSFGYLTIKSELNFNTKNLFFTSNPRNLLSFISEKFLYVYDFEYNGIVLFEKHESFYDNSLLILAQNMLITIKNKRCLQFSLYPFKLLFEFKLECDKLICTEITSDGKLLFIANNKDIDIYSLIGKGFASKLIGHKSKVTCMKINKSNTILVSGCGNRLVIVWDVLNVSVKYKYLAHKMEIQAIAISENDKYIVSGGQDWMLNVWSFDEKKTIVSIREKSWVNYVGISKDCKSIYSGLSDGTINCYGLNAIRLGIN